MAFNPERLALVVEPIGGVGLRWFNYQTDESEDDLIAADYLPNAEKHGLRAYDLIFVSPASGTEEPYILTVDSIDADGNATLVNSSRFGSDTLSYSDKAAVGLTRVPAATDNILVSAYDATVDPSVGQAYYRAASDADYTATPALLRLTDAGGRKFVINEKRFSLDMAGAPNDGTGDASAAFAAIMDLIRADAVASGTMGTTRYIIDGAGGTYRTTVSLDAANFTAWNLGLVNMTIVGACTGKTVLDLTGARGYFIDNVSIYGDPDARPARGVAIARTVENGYTGSQLIGRLTTDGYFSDTALHAYGMEGGFLLHCMIWNRDFAGRVAVFEGYDEHAITSDYTTPLTGATSMIWNKVLMSNFRHIPISGTDPAVHTARTPIAITKANPGVVTFTTGHPFENGDEVVFYQVGGMTELATVIATVANATATTIELSGLNTSAFTTFTSGGLVVKKASHPPVYLARVEQFDFDTCYITTYGQPHIELGFPDASFPRFDQIGLDILFEGGGSPHNILLSTGGAMNCLIRGLRVPSYNSNATVSFLSIEGGGAVTIYRPDIQVFDPVHSVDFVDLPASLTLSGANLAYRTLAATEWDLMAGFSGHILDISTGDEYPIGMTRTDVLDGTSTSFTVVSATGTITTLGTLSMQYRIDREWVEIELSITITTNGTGGGGLQVTLPSGIAAIAGTVVVNGSGRGVSGHQVQGYITSGTTLVLVKYDNTYPAADGVTVRFNGRYRRLV